MDCWNTRTATRARIPRALLALAALLCAGACSASDAQSPDKSAAAIAEAQAHLAALASAEMLRAQTRDSYLRAKEQVAKRRAEEGRLFSSVCEYPPALLVAGAATDESTASSTTREQHLADAISYWSTFNRQASSDIARYSELEIDKRLLAAAELDRKVRDAIDASRARSHSDATSDNPISAAMRMAYMCAVDVLNASAVTNWD